MLTPGAQIGKYLLGRKLGQGGFGVVFRAHDASLDREVALKFLHPEHVSTPQILQRFLQEARSAAKIAHPGIVTVFECGQMTEAKGEAAGAAYIAMELLVGESLTDRLARSGRLAPAAAMEIIRQVASALEAAHRAGIIHRDLKPDNIFLVQDPAVRGGERIKVLDFGIAKLGRAATSSLQTQSMMVFGTPRYMSPEQCKSAANVDHRSDIYTLGAILFELVTGQPPFVGEPGELIAQHLLVPPPTVISLVPDVPLALDKLIAVMLAKNPASRPQTMAQVQLALEAEGTEYSGVAPTMAADAISIPMMTPAIAAFGSRPVARPRGSTNTTLGAATGASVVRAPAVVPKRRTTLYIGGGVLAAAAAVAIFLGVRGGDEPKHVVEAAATPVLVEPKPAAPIEPKPAAPVEPKPAAPVEAKVVAPVAPVQPAVAPMKTVEKPAIKGTIKAPVSAVVTTGTIALSSRPVCDILVDGAPAGLHTPQRELKLSAGRHKITLVDAELKIKDSFFVDVKPNGTQSIEKDYLPKEVVKEVPKEIPKEVPKEIPKETPKQDGTKNGTINPFAKKP